MTESTFAPRLFGDEAAVARIANGLLAANLPIGEWTHEAHLAATAWLSMRRPDLVLEAQLPDIIRRYNVSTGGVNDDHRGYHETLTQLYIAGVRAHVEALAAEVPVVAAVNALIMSPRGSRLWPMQFYSRTRLFSVEARRRFVAPDVCDFEDVPADCTCKPRPVAQPMA